MLNVGNVAALMIPVTRVKRRITLSALAAAGVLPDAAVKFVTCTATVCPGINIEASVPPKLLTGTVRPLVSTVKTPGFTRVTCTGTPTRVLALVESKLLVDEATKSFATN